ncbi:MAG: elongation factor G [Kofleriaceae bacterium]
MASSTHPSIRRPALTQVRNLGIMAHVDAGKTTTTERILYYAGAINRLGEVDDGSTVTDWMLLEQERGISITAASTTLPWRGHVLNLIDTPGHVDFTMEVERSLRVLDGAVAVFCAVAGVQPQSETVWRQADRHRIPRVAFLNKCDRVGADPASAIASIRDRLRATPIAIQLPLGVGEDFRGVIDLLRMTARTWEQASFGARFTDTEIPAELEDDAREARDAMIEAIADVDDGVLSAVIAGAPTTAELVAGLRRATLAGRAVPTLLGAAFRNQGIHNLLDAIVDFLPSPIDLGEVRGASVTGDAPVVFPVSDSAPLAALAFKVFYTGDVPSTFLRVYSGVLTRGQQVLNATRGTTLTVGELSRVFANHMDEIPRIEAGMIGVVRGLKLATGDTLCSPSTPILLERIAVPAPVMTVVVEPDTAEDEARLARGLERLSLEDPSFQVRVDPETAGTVIAGMGELHLEIVVERLCRELGVRARVGRPSVAYRETVTQLGVGEHEFSRTLGGKGQAGHVRLQVEPAERGAGYTFENRAPISELPKHHVHAVREGIDEAVERGVLAGYSMTDLRVSILGGSYHPVDSCDFGYKIAGGKAFLEAAHAAGPTLLEPVMTLEVVTPEDYVGEVLGDLHARRGKITGIAAHPGVQTVACFVPMASMFGYATDLRSRTRGRATYAMEFHHYAEVPHQPREELVARRSA